LEGVSPEVTESPPPPDVRANPESPAIAEISIIDRPPQFDPAEVLPLEAPAKPNHPEDGRLSLEILGAGPFGSAEGDPAICGPLGAYALLCSLEPPEGLSVDNGTCSSHRKLFQTGGTRIENAWFADRSTLRLMINGGLDANSASNGLAIRAYQAAATSPGELRLAGKAIQLPASGPVFHSVEMLDPLMPVLLELSDEAGITQDFALLPFPSLLPGGIHAAELKALQTEANPMDAFWALSETLLQEALGRPDWPSRSIAEMSFEDTDLSGLGDMQSWLSAIFRMPPSTSKRTSAQVRLSLPSKSVPTITALVSRRLDVEGAGAVTGPFLVAEDSGARPRWSVALPADWPAQAAAPQLQRFRRSKTGRTNGKALPVHLSIKMTSPTAPPTIADGDLKNSLQASKLSVPLTVLLKATDPARTQALCNMLSETIGEERLELFVEVGGSDVALSDALHGIYDLSCSAARGGFDLRELARSARHEVLLTISDRVELNGMAQLGTICDLLNSDPKIASASCVLLGDAIFKKQVVLEPASGGLFPARVSFASSPRLAFSEPDVLQALPNMAYPVVANTHHFTTWRRDALTQLPAPQGPVPPMAADIRIGLDLMEAGFRNVCTSEVRARISGPYSRRDAIDPVGSAYLQPGRWEEILGRVTVLRELF
jgi:hypothetical protein